MGDVEARATKTMAHQLFELGGYLFLVTGGLLIYHVLGDFLRGNLAPVV